MTEGADHDKDGIVRDDPARAHLNGRLYEIDSRTSEPPPLEITHWFAAIAARSGATM
jgi:hypothetical protein